MKNLSRLALLSALALQALGCNLTYDREGLEFPSGLVCEGATPNRCEVTAGSPYCTDLSTSASNCGDCGLICSGTCSGGTCSGTVSCNAPLQACNDGFKDYCANVTSDATDCGWCGNSCGSQACGSGFCHVACDAALPDEWLVPGVGWQCFDFQNDKENCGSYGNACGATGCANGACLPAAACPPLATACSAGYGEYCSNLSEDPNNCGGCGFRCAAGTPCIDGMCLNGSTCPVTDGIADGLQLACADVQNDPRNCGSPGGTCLSGVCLGGACITPGFGTLGAAGYDWNFWATGTTLEDALFFGSPCTPGSGQSCVHLGEVRKVALATLSGVDCSNVIADDELGVFEWTCMANPGAPADLYVVSKGFKPGKGLADLIDSSLQWKQNAVRVWASGVFRGSTPRSAWWPSNPILPLPTDGNLTTAAVYVQPQSGKVNPNVTFSAQGASLAVFPGRVLSPVALQPAVLAADLSFIWIDGRIDASGAAGGVRLSNTGQSVLHGADLSTLPGSYDYGIDLQSSSNVRVEDSTLRGFQTGLYVNGGAGSRFASVRVEDGSGDGAYLYYTTNVSVDGFTARPGPSRGTFGATGLTAYGLTASTIRGVDVSGYETGLFLGNGSVGNRLTDVAAAACTYAGVELWDADGNLLDGIVASQNVEAGLLLSYADNNALVDVLAVGNGLAGISYGSGIHLYNSLDNRILAATSSGNLYGLNLSGSSFNVIVSGAFVGNGVGVQVNASTNNLLADVASAGNSWWGFGSDALSSTELAGRLLIGSNGTTGDCNTEPGAAGFSGVGTCAFTLPTVDFQVVPLDPAGAFAGYLSVDELVNPSDTGGTRYVTDLDDPLLDWFGFARPHRAWLGDGTRLGCDVPTARTSAACGSGAGTWQPMARIHDWSLPSTSGLLNALPQPVARSNWVHSWSGGGTSSFLAGALEFPGYGGNENGLCDAGANEQCLLTPNIGAYQGHNAPVSWTNEGITQVPGANLSRYYFNGY